jgi:hypothetical protein
MVWGSDYPHHDATFPGAVEAIRATVAPCPTAVQARVLGRNAQRLYRLPGRLDGPAATIVEYFSAVTAHDGDLLRSLFDPAATMAIDQVELAGIEAIMGYYEQNAFTFPDFRPDPGPLRVEGNRVSVPIDVHLGGQDRTVHDVFETDGSRITALRVSGFEEVLRAARSA